MQILRMSNYRFARFACRALLQYLLIFGVFTAYVACLSESNCANAQTLRYRVLGNERANDASPARQGYARPDSYATPQTPAVRTVPPTTNTIPRTTSQSRSASQLQTIPRSTSPSGVVRLRDDASRAGVARSNNAIAPVAPPQAPSSASNGNGVARQVTPRRSRARAVVDVDARPGAYLSQRDGRYDFLRIVDKSELEGVVRSTQGLCIVVPHKNFLFPSVKENEKEGSDAPSATVNLVGASHKPLPDDYVVFVLANLDEDERALLADSRDGAWNGVSLLDAALIAEGLTTREKRAHYDARFESLLATLSQQTRALQDELMKTEKVYTFLHSRALYSKYDLNCSSVAASLDSGVFNCVSATVLFNCFASRVGLRVAALETTGHAKSRVKYADSYLDLETTCTNWDRLPDRMRAYTTKEPNKRNLGVPSPNSESDSSEGGATLNLVSYSGSRDSSNSPGVEEGSTTFTLDSTAPLGYSFTRSRRPMREISDVELVATIYYNVGVDYYQSGAYERAIASYIKAVQLAPNNKTILGNLKATLNNWAIDVAMKEKDYKTAIQITDLGASLDPDFAEFKLNLPIFFHDWIESLGRDNKLDEIRVVQEEYKRRFAE